MRCQFRALLVGTASTGKTTLFRVFFGMPPPLAWQCQGSIGCEVNSKTLMLTPEGMVNFVVWDTPSMRAFRCIDTSETCPSVVLLCFSVIDRGTFEELKDKLVEQVRQRWDTPQEHETERRPTAVLVMVGTHADCTPKTRAVPQEDAKAYAKSQSMIYAELDARNPPDVAALFAQIARHLLQTPPSVRSPERPSGLKVVNAPTVHRDMLNVRIEHYQLSCC